MVNGIVEVGASRARGEEPLLSGHGGGARVGTVRRDDVKHVAAGRHQDAEQGHRESLGEVHVEIEAVALALAIDSGHVEDEVHLQKRMEGCQRDAHWARAGVGACLAYLITTGHGCTCVL